MQQDINYSSSIEFYLALCLLLPLLSFFLSFLISDRYAWAISFTSPFLQLISAFCAVIIFLRFKDVYTIPIDWFHIGPLKFTASVQINNMSVVMLPMVTIVSFLVNLYSTGYMAGVSNNRKYFAVLSFFTFSMLGIVLANDLLLVFVFWELVGFSSYVLIGHYIEKPEAASAAKKAFLFNRIGDVGFLVGLMIFWANTGTFDLSILDTMRISEMEPFSSGAFTEWSTVASLCIFCGIIGKSAQFPLFTWLPDAMVGPTPVSALIHAATMVAAGVFMLIRLDMLFTPTTGMIVTIVGAMTAIMGGISALSQTDIKKILAYSTISQLGLMIMVFWKVDSLVILHLLTHAFFKACLFLSAGAIIHALHQAQTQSHDDFDVQDIRSLGGLRKKLPFTFAAFIVSGCSLAGLPFTSGFLSKEAMLIYGGNSYIFILMISVLTTLYTFRLIWFVFMGKEKRTKDLNISEAPMVMRIPIGILMILSTWIAVSLNPFDIINGHLPIFDDINYYSFFEHALIPIALSAATIVIAFFIYRKKQEPHPVKFFQHGYYLDSIYTWLVTKPALAISSATSAIDSKWIDGIIHSVAYVNATASHLIAWFDRNIIDGTVHTVAATARGIGSFARSFQGGKIQLYIFWAALGLIIFIIWILVQ